MSMILVTKKVTRHFVKSHGKSKSFTNLLAASRWVATLELRAQIEPKATSILCDDARVWDTNEVNEQVRQAWFEAYASVFPADEDCRCCQRDWVNLDHDEGGGADYTRVATFCKTKRRDYIAALAKQIEDGWRLSHIQDSLETQTSKELI